MRPVPSTPTPLVRKVWPVPPPPWEVHGPLCEMQ
jgi:hypothetical protein